MRGGNGQRKREETGTATIREETGTATISRNAGNGNGDRNGDSHNYPILYRSSLRPSGDAHCGFHVTLLDHMIDPAPSIRIIVAVPVLPVLPVLSRSFLFGLTANSESIRDALYMSIVTLTTLGFGDFTPRDCLRWVAMGETLMGIFIVIVAIATVVGRIVGILGTDEAPEA